MSVDLVATLAKELHLSDGQVRAVIEMLDEGLSIPFIARYRGGRSGHLSPATLRGVQRRLDAERVLQRRRQSILKTIQAAGTLDEKLGHLISTAGTIRRLDDLYLPFKPKRRTLATTARQHGLEPLADAILEAREPGAASPEALAADYVNTTDGVASVEEAVAGACHILAERVYESRRTRERCRRFLWKTARLASIRGPRADREGKEYRDYYQFSEAIGKVPWHRVLTVLRGESKRALKVSLETDREQFRQVAYEAWIEGEHAQQELLRRVVEDGTERLLLPSLEREARAELQERAEQRAIEVAVRNLHRLLMQPILARPTILAINPGYRAGCQLAVLTGQGELVEHATVYPHQPRNQPEESVRTIVDVCRRRNIETIGIGDGTASRETEEMMSRIIAEHVPAASYCLVREAGTEVYAVSRLAKEELPDVEPPVREAVAIGRRLLDPIGELVKVEPHHLDLTPYAQDVSSKRLRPALAAMVEQCVNEIGVDVNVAGVPVLRCVAGLNSALARAIVDHRRTNGPFRSREQLREVAGLEGATFVEAAGFLYVRGGDNPLDATRVHPENYELCGKLLAAVGCAVDDLKTPEAAEKLRAALARVNVADRAKELEADRVLLEDIIAALRLPATDPRSGRAKPTFRRDVLTLRSLEAGTPLVGVVRNVVDFGAFVDIDLPEDGLVHISRLADRYIESPFDVVAVGEVVDVWVVEVDNQRGRVALSMISPERQKASRDDGTRAKREGDAGRREKGGEPSREPGRRARGTPRGRSDRKPADRPKARGRPVKAKSPTGPSTTSDDDKHLTYRPFAELAKVWRGRQRQAKQEEARQREEAAARAASADTPEPPPTDSPAEAEESQAPPAAEAVSTSTEPSPPTAESAPAGQPLTPEKDGNGVVEPTDGGQTSPTDSSDQAADDSTEPASPSGPSRPEPPVDPGSPS